MARSHPMPEQALRIALGVLSGAADGVLDLGEAVARGQGTHLLVQVHGKVCQENELAGRVTTIIFFFLSLCFFNLCSTESFRI